MKLIKPTENGFLNDELEHYGMMGILGVKDNRAIDRLNAAWLLVLGRGDLLRETGLRLEVVHPRQLPPTADVLKANQKRKASND